MNSLEFIDKEIKMCKMKIKKAQGDILYKQTMALLIPKNQNIDSAILNNLHISLNELKITHLTQIKKELEGYNEIKKYGISYENFKSLKEQ